MAVLTPKKMAEIAASVLSEKEHRGSGCWAVEVVTNQIFGQLYDDEPLNEVYTRSYPPLRVRVIEVRSSAWFTPEEALAIATTLDPQRVRKALNEGND